MIAWLDRKVQRKQLVNRILVLKALTMHSLARPVIVPRKAHTRCSAFSHLTRDCRLSAIWVFGDTILEKCTVSKLSYGC